MKTIVSPNHSLHWLKSEFSLGELKPCFETPARVEMVLNQLRLNPLNEFIEPKSYPVERLCRVHCADYIEFLENCWSEWEKVASPEADAMASVFYRPDMQHRKPEHIEGKLGYYSGDLTAGLGKGSWAAIKASSDAALSGADYLIKGDRAVLSLCRPAGHHASKRMMAGYCYVNNAAVAAQYLLDGGHKKVAILDVDYHHGNGTQSIFYQRSDVLCVSIHGDPSQDYPFYVGYADECGEGLGDGFNLNIPLALGEVGWSQYERAMTIAVDRINQFAPDVMIISLGVDTYEGDSISHFNLKSSDFIEMGRRIEAVGVPTLFVFEGGYGGAELGVNVANVIKGFESAVGDAG